MAGANANFRFVNAMLNIGYLTGAIVITEERDRFYVRQTGNEQLDIPVFLPNLGYRMPPRNSIKTVVVHCYSHITDSGSREGRRRLGHEQIPRCLDSGPLRRARWLSGARCARRPEQARG